MVFDQITILGVGLIGGSVGLAAKACGAAKRVVGYGRDQAKLDEAVRLGAIDTGTTNFAASLADAELVVVCTPVDRIASDILNAAQHCRLGTIFTDGGSTKEELTALVEASLPASFAFVPAHPLAGSEKNGVANARADLFVGRMTILTPTDKTDREAIERVEAFWKALGSRVERMNPSQHDWVLAFTSHLPHIAASSVAKVMMTQWLPFSAGGFRDTTRIAGGDPNLWASIFLENASVLPALLTFRGALDQFQKLLEAKDRAGLIQWLSEAKQVRDALGS